MKKLYTLIACCLISTVLLQYRAMNIKGQKLKVTTWDALGYYLYLPAGFIYKDVTELRWLPAADSKYGILQGANYPASREANGNYVMKYLGGVAIMESPFFLAARMAARSLDYPDDGFSAPFQYAIAIGTLFYCILAIFLLRSVLLRYFDEGTTAITLLLLCLATNFIQYAAVDSGMSHGYIFFLYAAILYATARWHEQPRAIWAILIGFISGLAAICRPTEAIMFLVPLLWNTHTKEAAKEKWQQVKHHKGHISLTVLFGFIAVLPQLIYWKVASGSFVYDVGSRWDFLLPHLRVLFGWEKGWFIYTPVTIFFVAGLFFVKRFPFRKAVLWFCLLNIYIIISWHEWRYAASYSTRALVESYPVFALPLAAFVDRVNLKKWRWAFYAAGMYLIAVNLFQLNQYNSGVLHYDDMNRRYYGRIYLNAQPKPLDMSLLDTDEMLCGEDKYKKGPVITLGSKSLQKDAQSEQWTIVDTQLANNNRDLGEKWIKIACDIKVHTGIWGSYLEAELLQGDSVKHNHIRLFNAISPEGQMNPYVFYVKVPEYFYAPRLKLYIKGNAGLRAELGGMSLTIFEKIKAIR